MKNNTTPLSIVGHIVEIESAIQGESWIKQNFTIRTLGDYPKLVHFTTFNTAQDQLSRCRIDDEVTVNLRSSSQRITKPVITIIASLIRSALSGLNKFCIVSILLS